MNIGGSRGAIDTTEKYGGGGGFVAMRRLSPFCALLLRVFSLSGTVFTAILLADRRSISSSLKGVIRPAERERSHVAPFNLRHQRLAAKLVTDNSESRNPESGSFINIWDPLPYKSGSRKSLGRPRPSLGSFR